MSGAGHDSYRKHATVTPRPLDAVVGSQKRNVLVHYGSSCELLRRRKTMGNHQNNGYTVADRNPAVTIPQAPAVAGIQFFLIR